MVGVVLLGLFLRVVVVRIRTWMFFSLFVGNGWDCFDESGWSLVFMMLGIDILWVFGVGLLVRLFWSGCGFCLGFMRSVDFHGLLLLFVVRVV